MKDSEARHEIGALEARIKWLEDNLRSVRDTVLQKEAKIVFAECPECKTKRPMVTRIIAPSGTIQNYWWSSEDTELYICLHCGAKVREASCYQLVTKD